MDIRYEETGITHITSMLDFSLNEMDEVLAVNSFLNVLNKLDIPYKECWSSIGRDLPGGHVYYFHTKRFKK
jgi:hypothetical protein